MKYLFVGYPRCSTSQKAKQWLDAHGIVYTERHIVEHNPTENELRDWLNRSGLPLKRFFNTSGLLYKEKNLKEKLPNMSEDEQISLLASSGMLVKRPLFISDQWILVGFNQECWSELLINGS